MAVFMRQGTDMKAAIGDQLPRVPDKVWEKMSRIEPMVGPRCYLCNGIIRGDWRNRIWVCVGPGQDRRVFEAFDPAREGLDVTQGGQDMVHIGRSCVKKYVPKEALVPRAARAAKGE